MQRRTFLATGTGALGLHSLPAWTRFLHLNPYEMKLIRRNVGFFTEKGGTIGYLVQPEGIIVVDAQFKEQSEHLIKELQSKSSAPFSLSHQHPSSWRSYFR
jgi:hypothetical protein